MCSGVKPSLSLILTSQLGYGRTQIKHMLCTCTWTYRHSERKTKQHNTRSETTFSKEKAALRWDSNLWLMHLGMMLYQLSYWDTYTQTKGKAKQSEHLNLDNLHACIACRCWCSMHYICCVIWSRYVYIYMSCLNSNSAVQNDYLITYSAVLHVVLISVT